MHGRTIGQFYIPAVVDDTTVERDWKYSGWRVVVTEQAESWMVRHLTNLKRS
jgi:hypothetical protein